MRNVLGLICICGLILSGTGCRDTLWYQASILSDSDELTWGKMRMLDRDQHQQMVLLQLASRSVKDASECARLCYISMAPICGSAIFEVQPGSNSWCRLLTENFPCGIGLGLVSSVDERKSMENMLLHCFYCNRFAESGQDKETFASENEEKEINLETKIGTIQEFDIGNDRTATKPIRVMTFNTWISGNNVHDGLSKIAKHIFANDPHIVALQELDEYSANKLRDELDTLYQQRQRLDVWYHCRRNMGGLNHILTRFPVKQEHQPSIYLKNNGCQLKIGDRPEKYAHVWNLHLHWEDYAPYAACSPTASSTSTSMEDLLFRSEYKPREPARSRLHQTLRFLHHRQLKDVVTLQEPNDMVLVMGDFNSPSHLDWTRVASSLHCNISYEWPVSKLMADFGLMDSFRKVNPDSLREPGFTWSPIYKTKTWISVSSTESEPQDRIDFIYYSNNNKKLTPRRSVVYKGSHLLGYFPHHAENDWPSDHAAVVTDFEVTLEQESN